MKNKFLEQTKHEYSPRQRFAAFFIEAPFFLGVIPFVLVTLGRSIDRWFGWLPILYQPINLTSGLIILMTGWFYAIWSIYVQFTLGRGTPVPLMATQKLIIQPPYSFSRNPMALGAILMYLGIGILFGSIGALVLVAIGSGLLLTYIKLLEEKEMVIRFGQKYLAYRERTPFLIPRFRNKGVANSGQDDPA